MRHILFGVFVALHFMTIYPAHAQKKRTDANISGHVLDSQTKEHIPFAAVALKGTTIGGATDASGHFFLKNLPVGEGTVVASFIGYKTVEIQVKIENLKTLELNFELEPQLLQVDEVVVTGSRNETNRRESSTIVNVMSARLIETTASSCASDVLNFQSGLRLEQTCSNCGVPQLRINGLEGHYSQILLDSRPIFSSLASVYGLEQIPTGMIERVEVIRGGGSALFGSSAIGGVVNIITKEPLRNTLTVSNNWGVFGRGEMENNTTLNGAFVTDDYKAGVYVFGMVKNKDAYDRNKDGFSETPKINSETIGFRGYYRVSPSSKLTAEYHHIREFRRGGDSLHLPPHEANIAEQLQHQIDGGGLKYDFATKDYKHRVNLYTSAQKVDRGSYFGTEQDLNAYGSTQDFTWIAGGQYTYDFTRMLFMPSTFIIGAEYTDNRLKDEMQGYNRRIDQKSVCYGTFFQNEWKSDQFSFLAGARLDKHNQMKNPVFNPRLNLRYTPVEAIGIRTSYSSGYRAPQAYDEDLHVEAVGGKVSIITIDPNLKPEYSNSLSASVDLYQMIGKNQVNVLVECFYTNIKNVFTLEPKGTDADGNYIWERRNGSGAVVKGVNLEMKLALTTKMVIDGGYTFQKSRYKEALKWTENPEIKPGKRMFRAPDQYGYLTFNYMPVKRLSMSLSGNYTGSMLVQHKEGYIDQDEEKRTPDFFDVGVRIAYDISLSSQMKLQLSGGVKNIFDQYQSDADKGKFKDAGYVYGPAMPRVFYLGAKFSL